jgi:hypothetical protein
LKRDDLPELGLPTKATVVKATVVKGCGALEAIIYEALAGSGWTAVICSSMQAQVRPSMANRSEPMAITRLLKSPH